jgi:tetratricopeptide (TPR) repeat protein
LENNNNDISPEEWAQIDDHLSGRMPAAEYEAFRLRMAHEPLLAQKVADTSMLVLGIRESVLQNRLHDFHMGITSPAIIRKTAFGKYWLVAASVLVIVTAGIFFMFNRATSDEKLFARYYQQDPGLPTLMSIGSNDDLDRGMVDYKTGQYNTAITRWKGLLATKPASDTINYFIGCAWMALQQADSAKNYFKKVTGQYQSVFRSDACWFLALTLLKQNRHPDAIMYLQQSSHPRKDDILSELK